MKAPVTASQLKQLAPGAAVLLLGLGIAGTLIATTPKPLQAEAEERAHAVSIEVIEPALQAPAVNLYGRIEAASITDLEAPLTAPVADVTVREGDWVEAGTLLVQLDDTATRLELRARQAETLEAQATLASLQADAALTASMAREQEELAALADARLTRFEELFERRMVARQLLDEVRQDAAVARMTLARFRAELADFPNRIARQQAVVARAEVTEERSRIDLERTRIRAPFSGPVLAIHAARGNQVLAGAPLVRLADAASFEVRATLPTDHARRLRAQFDAGFPIHAETRVGDDTIPLHLARLSSAQRPGRTGIDAFFALTPGPGTELGRVVDMRVALPAEPDLVALPVAAIYENNRIYRVEDGRLRPMTIEVVGESHGQSHDQSGYRVLVRSTELRAGQRIITTALPQAMSGLRVSPVTDRVAMHESSTADAG
ncbi:MAG: HlyD family efflux transporter periplasmic adaptor subunit [Gammaproteobacteria bacterium]|nr:HlyD family efflux transporter periplasmic adaptor subunit [Gammaproteobacteria bacterium]